MSKLYVAIDIIQVFSKYLSNPYKDPNIILKQALSHAIDHTYTATHYRVALQVCMHMYADGNVNPWDALPSLTFDILISWRLAV